MGSRPVGTGHGDLLPYLGPQVPQTTALQAPAGATEAAAVTSPRFPGRQGPGRGQGLTAGLPGASPETDGPTGRGGPYNLGSRRPSAGTHLSPCPTYHPRHWPPPRGPCGWAPGKGWGSGAPSQSSRLFNPLDPDQGLLGPLVQTKPRKEAGAPGGSSLSAHFHLYYLPSLAPACSQPRTGPSEPRAPITQPSATLPNSPSLAGRAGRTGPDWRVIRQAYLSPRASWWGARASLRRRDLRRGLAPGGLAPVPCLHWSWPPLPQPCLPSGRGDT